MKFEEYQRLAELLKEAIEILSNFKLINPKKAPINKFYRRTLKGINEAKCWAEEMMFQEYPEKATTEVFY
jgi:hypothetical protein